MSNRFIAIDFETANAQRISACSVGVAVIENGTVTDSFSSLIKPPEEASNFFPLNVKIHGITPEMVENAPSFDEIYPQLRRIADNASILGYTKFDKSVLSNLAEYYNLPVRRSKIDQYIDVCTIAKDALPSLKNHKLNTLAKHLNLGKFNHHDALADAIMCARIFLALSRHKPERIHSDLANAKSENPSPEEIANAFRDFSDSILEDGIIDYKEAVELRSFVSVIPKTVGLRELSLTLDDFMEDGVIDSDESLVLCELVHCVHSELAGLPHVKCPECNAPIRKEILCTISSCPWCDAPLPW